MVLQVHPVSMPLLDSIYVTSLVAMRDLFCDDRTQAALLVDTSNAFNSVNHQAALHNISMLCSQYMWGAPTCYWSRGNFLTWGYNSLAMSMHALAMVPLIKKLNSTVSGASQVWFADDATAIGPVSKL